MLKIHSITLLCVLLNACSSNHKVGVVYHDRFDFSQVKSYSLYNRNSPFTDSQSLIDTRRNAIELAIERNMSINKFNYAELEQADVIVTYYLLNGNSTEYAKYNDVVRFCVQCLRANAWQTTNQYSNIAKGSLILDLVDPKNKRSVWRSAYPLDIDVKDNSAKLNEKIQQAVSLMLALYPKSTILMN
ncbi:DUF4136 domain-containing protein [Candidatus Colwellia aromaticivorans]|uniref:DUF4136 domain-containing protein n=1 Tax=Candidatus Colwellia aromaticivorans TaxID=2267621 RepID=UPI000DF2E18F|nr:DUF4136 domain-containing protein [Candidatus Colwellia aromaticivorans]